jgi:hypothetical protein
METSSVTQLIRLFIQLPNYFLTCYLALLLTKLSVSQTNTCYQSVQNILSSHLRSKNVKIKIYKTTTLSVVLYGPETWSLILREEHKMRVFGNRVLMGILGPNSYEMTRVLRKLHNEELRNLCASPSIIRMIKSRRMRWAV